MIRIRPTIEENIKVRLQEWLNQLESGVIDLHSHLENNNHISEGDWKSIDKMLSNINRVVVDLREEINYG
ncbi:hypothetical protein [Bacillus sp. SM2101]|uniref:hypothetical protein n=1 Tax=Bacillus sp. SM2101 TaxID=2805366 RepID=UPI001BDE2058|nr:hypothetical protein [Bacillus sp. SM2101]